MNGAWYIMDLAVWARLGLLRAELCSRLLIRLAMVQRWCLLLSSDQKRINVGTRSSFFSRHDVVRNVWSVQVRWRVLPLGCGPKQQNIYQLRKRQPSRQKRHNTRGSRRSRGTNAYPHPLCFFVGQKSLLYNRFSLLLSIFEFTFHDYLLRSTDTTICFAVWPQQSADWFTTVESTICFAVWPPRSADWFTTVKSTICFAEWPQLAASVHDL